MRPSSAETSEPAWTNRKMLSMNSSTSWPSSSRKYSAMVRPVSATRMRAPGGSFIWPNTSIVLSRTPDSFISSQRSLPSRERSPTPQNAERPPCSCAMLWISSWMSTVLPTPAPPKRPTFPPFAYGASRSITLMPVSKISRVGVRSSTSGAGRWIGQRSSDSTSPSWSIGSPSRLKIRPSVPSPTGTVIGPPVSRTSVPRERPSVESIATARTRSSPRCCCTSATRSIAGRPSCSGDSIRRAVLISGSCSGKTASITTPLISTILPTLRALPFDSGMRLLKSASRGGTGSAKALHKPRQCIEARCDEAHPSEPGVLLERRHPGGVVEASAVGADERRDHGLTVPVDCVSLHLLGAWGGKLALRAEERGADPALQLQVAVVRVRSADVRCGGQGAGRGQVEERREPEGDGRGGGRQRAGRAEEHAPPAARERDRLLRALERSSPHEPARHLDVALERPAGSAAGQMRLEHLLRKLRELAVEPQRDPLAAALAKHAMPWHEPHYGL